jgi:hydrogenase expression/formation protein HypE
LQSDTAPVAELVALLLDSGVDVRFLRDPTRGGVSAVMHEIVEAAGVAVVVDEAAVPVNEEVRSACGVLGIDPLHVANEGKLIAIVAPADAEAARACLAGHPLGKHAAVIGEISGEEMPGVLVRGPRGGLRVLDDPSGAPLPRIC